MRAKDIKIGDVYEVRVSGTIARVRIYSISIQGGWIGRNVATGRTVRLRTAGRIRGNVTAGDAYGHYEIWVALEWLYIEYKRALGLIAKRFNGDPDSHMKSLRDDPDRIVGLGRERQIRFVVDPIDRHGGRPLVITDVPDQYVRFYLGTGWVQVTEHEVRDAVARSYGDPQGIVETLRSQPGLIVMTNCGQYSLRRNGIDPGSPHYTENTVNLVHRS